MRFQSADFHAGFRGRAVAAPPLRFVDVRYMGMLISDRQAGPFTIKLREIKIEAGESETE